jgi:hypothetical protein
MATAEPPASDAGLPPELGDVARRLHAEFDADLGAEVVSRALQVATERFVDARVRSFVPLLVHRMAREELRAVAPRAAPDDEAEG